MTENSPVCTGTTMPLKAPRHEAAIDILRGLTFLCVLFGHSFPDSAYEYISPLTKYLHDYIYSFHMPLFFFISGFCMLHVLARRDLSLYPEIWKRAERLLVPYLFWSYVAIVPKILFAGLMYLPFDKSQILTILLGQSPNGTLWYLWTLFFVNLLYLLISRLTRDWRFWMVCGITVYLGSRFVAIPYFESVFRYQLWFVLGCIVSANWDIIKSLATKMAPYTPLLFIINIPLVVFLANAYLPIQGNIASTFVCGFALLSLSIWLSNQSKQSKNSLGFQFLLVSSRYSYSIYLLSPWVQVAVRVFLYSKLGLPYPLCMALMFTLGWALPYATIRMIESSRLKQHKLINLVFGL